MVLRSARPWQRLHCSSSGHEMVVETRAPAAPSPATANAERHGRPLPHFRLRPGALVVIVPPDGQG
jgi:hypothetical protein